MNTNEIYTLFVGLLKSDMKTPLNADNATNAIIQGLIRGGVMGCNIEMLKGVWNGKIENTLKVSFINTFGITQDKVNEITTQLKAELEQESILVQRGVVEYDFL
jgi:hypothetical protein